MDLSIEFREVAKTKKIHAFNVVGGVMAEVAICHYKPTSPLTYPVLLEDLMESPQMCKACLSRYK
jgi:hypothetical protein